MAMALIINNLEMKIVIQTNKFMKIYFIQKSSKHKKQNSHYTKSVIWTYTSKIFKFQGWWFSDTRKKFVYCLINELAGSETNTNVE